RLLRGLRALQNQSVVLGEKIGDGGELAFHPIEGRENLSPAARREGLGIDQGQQSRSRSRRERLAVLVHLAQRGDRGAVGQRVPRDQRRSLLVLERREGNAEQFLMGDEGQNLLG